MQQIVVQVLPPNIIVRRMQRGIRGRGAWDGALAARVTCLVRQLYRCTDVQMDRRTGEQMYR